jgi:coproporphyrinogen III oxidase
MAALLGCSQPRPRLAARPRCSGPRHRAAASAHAVRARASAASAPLADFEAFVLDAQSRLCADVAALDGGASFGLDAWERSGDAGGYGRTRVLEGGRLLEKAAANVSVVRGVLSASRAAAMSARGRPGVDPKGGQAYSAVALSLVFHAASPMVPTLRADVRAFAVEGSTAFYGGGADLTPAYVFPDDAKHFHATLATLCDAHQPPAAPRRALYAACKRACDDYFFLVRLLCSSARCLGFLTRP